MAKRIFSGAQPTNNLHIGNYIGALKNWAALQREYESFFCIVNLHAVTLPQDPRRLAEKTRELARMYLAAGIDPRVSTVFVQSDVPEHAELAWVLNCVARVGELERMTQFKDKAKRQREQAGAGILVYPTLMAADILLYHTDLVPVGHDQKQHLELTRDLAQRFNRDYGETFTLPEVFIPKVGAKIAALDDPTRKMSKSDENDASRINMLDDPDTVRKKFRRAVTDSGTEVRFDESRPGVTNLLSIYQIMTGRAPAEIEAHFEGKGYGRLKEEVAEATIEYLRPFQERVRAITDEELGRILAEGRDRARSIAGETLRVVYERLGIVGA